MKILQDYDLAKLNTFGISARAKFLTEVGSLTELEELFTLPEFKQNKKIFLGSGSNVLFTKDFEGLVILNKLKGIKILKAGAEVGKDFVLIKAMGGEVWHNLVIFAVDRGYWGIENLSLIPGTVGAAPMQNIGAYGAELANVLENVESIEIATGNKRIFTKEECELGYRDSIFKNKLKNKYFISAITLKLSKKEKKNISYKILSDHIEKNKIQIERSKDISNAVCQIRRSKLPDPKVIGNAGSFFKNVFVEDAKIKEMLSIYPHMPYFKENGMTKIPAGWLVEQSGWKGKRIGNVGVHEKQALVIVNHGGANGAEIKNLAEQIVASVLAKFGLELIPEVNLI